MKTTDFLDALRDRYDCSDYHLHKMLGISKQAVSDYRTGRRTFSEKVATQVADLLDMDRAYVLAEVAAESAKTPAAIEAWRRAAEHLANLSRHAIVPAVATLALLCALAAPVKGYAHSALNPSHRYSCSGIYIMSIIRALAAAIFRAGCALCCGPRQPISAACLAY